MYRSLRRLLFQMDPEQAHEWTIRSLKWMQANPWIKNSFQRQMTVNDPRLHTTYWGLSFPNPVGLAAGFDKHANVYPGLAALGFGYVEVGTLTPRPQSGNPKPRLFRLLPDQAVINRMGFNNDGAEAAKESFTRLPRPSIPIGINLGKNKDTPNDEAAVDYRKGLNELYSCGDYFVINISSPNTKGLRDLQHAASLNSLLAAILEKRDELAKKYEQKRPILLKIAPDLENEEVEEIVTIALEKGIDGIIATNTTISREGLSSPLQKETGGLSGRPLVNRSTAMIRRIYKITRGRVPIIGVGGIFTGQDAYDKIRAGANLIQVYTGMIYRGPSIAKWINQELLELMNRDQVSSISDLVGLDHQ
ncbi:quinone-dependent dihydroorotate dehydrogenase [Thermoactinomyces sp. CICC 10523]|uniref:quinone-dependent dihydroorotate dehydrogenase n=1 Tax=Thermoactinomyces sp. CICC 10523 TaxID=2767428 RepID=UPI0018DE804D|nr:quinone-dependent dihydroorotate dehydrogenase [Thermoactinomyces sp. CICC 10523]